MKHAIDPNTFKRFSTRTVVIPVVGSFILSGIFVYIIFQLLAANHLVVQSARVLRQVNENMKLMVNAETGVRGYLLTGDESYLEPYNNTMERGPEQFNKLIAMTEDNLGQNNRAKDMQIAFNAWNEYGAKAIELRRSNKDIEKILPAVEGKKRMDDIRAIFTRFDEVETILRDKRNQETQETIKLALSVILGCSIIGGVAIAVFTRRQLTSLSSTYNNVIQKQVEQNQILEAQEWIQTGKTGLMENISGDISVEELSNRVLKYLCNRLDGKVGALYNSESGMLRRTGTYAFTKDPETAIVKFGEGLVGQTALERRLIVISDVPEQYLTVSSTVMTAKPNQIVLLPLIAEKTIKGVLEIGFLDRVSDRMLEYLDEVAESIAIALRSAEYRATLNNLLEESQRQTEELQAQQEELQANNEELEEQTNALKESQLKLELQQSELEQTNQQLAKQSLELENQADEVNRKNEELRQAQLRLEHKARELEQSSQYKSQFLANMSHELRTPLNSTLILSQLLLEDKRGRLGEEEKEFAQTIFSSSNDLLNLINDILDLSKVEAGKIDLEPEDIILEDFSESLERLFKPIANNKNIEFKINLAPGIPTTIFQDRQRLEQILKNLVSNAIKFTEKGSVTIRVTKKDGRIEFAVIDTGIGIPFEQQEIIFDAFKQADGTTSRRFGGTGLGLTISKDLAKLLGGTISVSSEPGKGSIFTLNLPEKHDVDTLPEAVLPSRLEKSVIAPTPTIAPKAKEPPPMEYKSLPFEDDRNRINDKIKILLVVEDDTNFSKILYDLSHELKFNCLVAQTAAEAIKTAEEYLPQAILLDMHLPDRSGLTVIDDLKSNPKTSHIPIHIISALDHANMALKMGAVGYLKKPVSLNDIKTAIAKMEEKLTHSLKKVLVVEDNKVQRESIKELIQDKTVEVVMAENATNALESLKKHTFDCMILDLNLPGMTGYELLEKMTGTEGIYSPPVIVYTGKDLSKSEEQKLQKYSQSIILKGAHSPERLFSEVSLFLHQVEDKLPKERQKMLQKLRDREKIFEGKKILLADDDVRNIFALSAALEGQGAVVETARNGKEALDKVKNDLGIDLVLMDIMMPEMDGYTATREIRKDQRFAKLPIIAVTAKAMADDQEKCREAGANDYLAKPVDLTKLLSLLRVWMPQNGRL